MMTHNPVPPLVVPPLDAAFAPLALANRAFRAEVAAAGDGVPLVIGLERGDGSVSRYDTQIFPEESPESARNFAYVERLVKTLLWARGACKLYIGGPRKIGEAVAWCYAPRGARAFDDEVMAKSYERPFTVLAVDAEHVPAANESVMALGGHLHGCRLGFDAGASDIKVAAVHDGRVVFSEEYPWDPRPQTDPQYHYDRIMAALHAAAAHLPQVDAIGVSSAGIYVHNRIMNASLFRGVSPELYEKRVKNLFLEIQQAWKVPLEVVNDGEVTALAGAMSLQKPAMLGVAMGSSEAAGFITPEGNITNWLNELAFVPIDVNPAAPADEWSGDIGCGVQYLSQQAVGRLLPAAGITLDEQLGLPERLKAVQQLAAAGDERVTPLYQTIGCYLGYALAHYADFYDFHHALILGRVTSGEGGHFMLQAAHDVLAQEFPALAMTIALHLPDEASRRVGQAIAAASLPKLPA